MARKKIVPIATTIQQSEADVIAEIGATPDDDEELEVDEAKVREIGAVDAESVIENRRVDDIINRVRSGEKGVPFNLDNLLQKYDALVQTWPPNSLDILVQRVTGTPVQYVIQSRPKSGGDLYTEILARHGRYEEAKYDVRFVDCTGKRKRGTGHITMPDTRDTPPMQQPQQGQSMNYQSPQQPTTVQVVPPTVDPIAMMGKMFEIFQQMRPQQAAPPPAVAPQQVPVPVVVQPPPTDPMAMMGKMFEIFQKTQQAVQPTPSAQAPSVQQSPATDPMAMMQESFRLFQQMQVPQAAAMPPPPPQGSDPSAIMAWVLQKMQQPQPAAPDPMAMMDKMFTMFQRLQPAPAPAPGPQRPHPRSGERPYYSGGPQGQQEDSPGDSRYQSDPRYPYQPPQQQQRPKTMAEEFRDATTIIQTAVDIAEKFRPTPPAPEPERYRNDDEDNPVRVMKVGDVDVLINKSDGSARKWETAVALLPTVLKWGAEQREAIMKAQTEREAKQQQRVRLPEGYVEVTEGYKPPPGFVAVPVEMGQGLPPPPENMPEPISQQEELPPRSRTWGAPTVVIR